MNMKKLPLVLTLIGAGAFGHAMAADGTVNFTGSIIADACKVDDASKSMNVDLGQVAATSFTKNGDKASPTAFSIKLTDCPDSLKAAMVKFDGTPDTVNANLLKIDASSDPTNDAKSVAIEIAERDGQQIPLHTASKAVTIANGAATLPFVARYVATADAVNAGLANGTSQFTVNYQ